MPQVTNPIDPERGNSPVDDRRDQSQRQSALNEPSHRSHSSHGKFEYGDGSWDLFSIYSKVTENEDNSITKRWQKDAQEIMLFTGLFSATVAALLVISIQDLKPDPQDTSAFYLENIYQLLAQSNISSTSFPSAIAKPPPFSPPRYAIWVNSLWFLSLVISLTSALLASLLQRWARRYLKVTQPRYSPHKRARIRAFFAHGLERMHFPWAADAVPTLQHLSLFLFLVGLLILLWNTHLAVFRAVVGWVVLSTVVYAYITLLPIFRPDSPYYTPLSSLVWPLYGIMTYLFSNVLSITGTRGPICMHLLGRIELIAEETVLKRSSEFDARILESTLDALGEDETVEKFFKVIPSFLNSNLVNELKKKFPSTLRIKFLDALDGFLHRTLLSDSVMESIKIRRLVICLKATDVIHGSHAVSRFLHNILDEPLGQGLQSIEAGHSLAHWCKSEVQNIAEPARCVVARILAGLRKRDDYWIALAVDTFRLQERQEHVIRDNIHHGDSVLLSISIHCTRQVMHPGAFWTPRILSSLSKFQVRKALPELQHDFCALWNEVVRKAMKEGVGDTFVEILRRIRRTYVALHQRTSAAPTAFSALTSDSDRILHHASSYPLCTISSHHPHTPPQMQTATAGEASHPVPVPTSSTVPQRGVNLNTIAPPTRPDRPTLNHPISLGMAYAGAMQGVVDISGTASPDPGSTSNGDLQVEEGQAMPSISFPLTPVSIPGPNSESSPVVLSSVDSVAQTRYISHPGSPPSSSTASLPPDSPQVTTAADQYTPSLNIGTSSVQGDPNHENPPIPMEVFNHLIQSEPSDTDVDVNTVRPNDSKDGP